MSGQRWYAGFVAIGRHIDARESYNQWLNKFKNRAIL